jgi:mercuric ion transport protein
MMDTTNTTSSARGVMTYVMGAIAVLTCPCHLPILIVLLSGTAAGALLAQNLFLTVVLLLAVFLLSAAATWRLAATGRMTTGGER